MRNFGTLLATIHHPLFKESEAFFLAYLYDIHESLFWGGCAEVLYDSAYCSLNKSKLSKR